MSLAVDLLPTNTLPTEAMQESTDALHNTVTTLVMDVIWSYWSLSVVHHHQRVVPVEDFRVDLPELNCITQMGFIVGVLSATRLALGLLKATSWAGSAPRICGP